MEIAAAVVVVEALVEAVVVVASVAGMRTRREATRFRSTSNSALLAYDPSFAVAAARLDKAQLSSPPNETMAASSLGRDRWYPGCRYRVRCPTAVRGYVTTLYTTVVPVGHGRQHNNVNTTASNTRCCNTDRKK